MLGQLLIQEIWSEWKKEEKISVVEKNFSFVMFIALQFGGLVIVSVY